jgi:1,4-alpha-glucan branching enzyme
MHGSYEDKFRQMRAALMLQMTYPGKKLMFMGTEFAQFREWNYDDSLEWFMLDYPTHAHMREYVAALNALYLKTAALWELDFTSDGFSWILSDEADKNTVAYRRIDKSGDSVVVVINLSGSRQAVRFFARGGRKPRVLFETLHGVSSLTVDSSTPDGAMMTVELDAFSGVIYKEYSNKIKIKA